MIKDSVKMGGQMRWELPLRRELGTFNNQILEDLMEPLNGVVISLEIDYKLIPISNSLAHLCATFSVEVKCHFLFCTTITCSVQGLSL